MPGNDETHKHITPYTLATKDWKYIYIYTRDSSSLPMAKGVQRFATNGEGGWWRCRSTEAKQAKSDRGAPYIYWGYSRWALASTIVALSQHGSKAGSCGRSWQVCSLVTSSYSSPSSYASSFACFFRSCMFDGDALAGPRLQCSFFFARVFS